MSAADMVPVLFRRQLDRHQTGFALGEALAHLHYLVGQGEIERTPGRARRRPLPAQGGVRSALPPGRRGAMIGSWDNRLCAIRYRCYGQIDGRVYVVSLYLAQAANGASSARGKPMSEKPSVLRALPDEARRCRIGPTTPGSTR